MATLYVSAPVGALVEGVLREDKSIDDLLKNGNLGLGTFNDLDGEMVILDGQVYRIDIDSVAHKSDAGTLSPYACVVDFKADSSFNIETTLSYQEFLDTLSARLRSKNFIYAFKIHGCFDHVTSRSVPKQHAYRPLVDVAHDQKETALDNVIGTLVGFWTPSFMQSINVPGFHLHFLTDDKTHGGHLMNCIPKSITVELQEIHHLDLELPTTKDYGGLEFSRDCSKDLNEADH